MKVGTIYSASDKALFDALNQKNVTNAELRQLFLSRGILVSPDSSRKSLAMHFARLFHDYHDYQTLASLFGGTVARDKLSTVRLTTKATLDNFQSGASELKAELEQGGSIVKIYRGSGNRLDIEVRYTKVHFNKSEFRQVSNRTSHISIQQTVNDVVINSSHNDETKEWINQLIQSIREKNVADIEFNEIELPPTLSAKAKTAFFTSLVRNIPTLPLRDVTDVYVTKPRDRSDDENSDEASPEIRIDKASLRGQGVLESQELSLLERRGFYVSRIIWTSKQPGIDTDVLEFEAQFALPEECRDFAYLPRGFYKSSSSGGHAKSRTAFSQEDERKYGVLIEQAARKSLKTTG